MKKKTSLKGVSQIGLRQRSRGDARHSDSIVGVADKTHLEQNQPFDELEPAEILDAAEMFDVRCTGRLLQLNSMENRVYEVEIEMDGLAVPEDYGSKRTRGEAFRVMKFYRPGRWTRGQILDEHLFLQQLNEAGIPSVPPVKDSNGESLIRLSNGIFAAMFPRIGGRNPEELDKPSLLRLGRLIARMHQVGARVEIRERPTLNVNSYGYDSLEAVEESGLIPEELFAAYKGIAERLLKTIEPWFSSVDLIRVHGDLHRGNILWNDDGPFFVDFDDMLSAPAAQDLWLIEPGRDSFALEARELLIRGYEELRHFNREEMRLFEALRSLRMIRYNGWIADRYRDQAFKSTFPMFTSAEYWRSELGALVEQQEILSAGIVMAY